MNRFFADTAYWIALLHPRDTLRSAALSIKAQVDEGVLVTTQAVFIEVLAFFSGHGPVLRRRATESFRELSGDPRATVAPLSEPQFLAGLTLYEARPDKGHSLVDCISMTVMRELGITTALTSDRHFEQEGFEILLK